MRILIVDDEPLARERLRRLILELPDYEIAGEADNGRNALALVETEEPDIVLMDIQMGGPLNGMQVARTLALDDMPPAVVFTTAYPEHALAAFGTGAAGYLVKPVRLDSLREALQKIQKLSRAQLGTLPYNSLQRPKREAVVAITREGRVRIAADTILYFFSDQKYTTVRHLQGEHLISEPLRTLEADFYPWVLRIHRRYLISVRFIDSLERMPGEPSQFCVRMQHVPDPLPVSRRRVAMARRSLMTNNR